jgi:histidinol-phosphate aminotransferase
MDDPPMTRVPLDRFLRRGVGALQAPVYPAPTRGAAAMDANTNLLGPNPAIAETARRVGRLALNQYPTGNSDPLRDALADAWRLRREHFVVGNGSDELFDLVTKAFVGPGDPVAFPVPSFVMYPFYARINLGRAVPVPLGPGFALDVERLLRARPRVILLASPNSPTGNAFPRAALDAVIRRAPGIVVVDEAYAEFCDQALIRRAPRAPNLIVTRTFSKAHGLAGLRIGYAAGPPPLIDALLRVKPPFNVDAFAEAAAIGALRNRGYVRRVVRTIRAERARVAASLRAMGFRPYPSDANFLLADVGRPSAEVARALRAAGFLVRAMTDWPGLATCIRVTLGPPALNDRFLRALGRAAGGGAGRGSEPAAGPGRREG